MLVIKTILTIFSLLGLGCGLLMVFAGGMSDAPYEGEATANSGITLAGVSLVVLIGCIVWMFF